MTENIGLRRGRIIRLEACRGIAALVVVCHHIILGFAPSISGLLPGTRTPKSLAGTVFFFLINGTGAVIFFFVLSGYVLTVRFFDKPNTAYIAIAALKRLPRLALLTTIVTLGSAIIWLSGLYRFQEASTITRSQWLYNFAFASLPTNFHPSLLAALSQGMWGTFINGSSYYDSSLWTMQQEFHGSFVVFLAAPFLIFIMKKNYTWIIFAMGVIMCWYASPYMIPFIAGLAIAYSQRKIASWRHPLTTAALVVIGVYCLGFVYPDEDYAVFAKLTSWHPGLDKEPNFAIIVLTIGAASLVVAVLQSEAAKFALDNKVGAMLGHLSFPIYLVHVPIICSASSALYLLMFPTVGKEAILWAAALTLILTIMVAWPLAEIDVRWVRFLNSWIGAPFKKANAQDHYVLSLVGSDSIMPASPVEAERK